MKLFRKNEGGHFSFVQDYAEPTGREVQMRDPHEVPFEGKGLSVGMVKSSVGSDRSAVIFHCGLENPTWDEIDAVSERVNRAWRVAYGDTSHVFFEGASLYGDIIWLWFGS